MVYALILSVFLSDRVEEYEIDTGLTGADCIAAMETVAETGGYHGFDMSASGVYSSPSELSCRFDLPQD